jgi:hypothetical protein
VKVHSLTLSHILGRMKCDSRASLLACTFASPCFGHKPKVRVVTRRVYKLHLIFLVLMGKKETNTNGISKMKELTTHYNAYD